MAERVKVRKAGWVLRAEMAKAAERWQAEHRMTPEERAVHRAEAQKLWVEKLLARRTRARYTRAFNPIRGL